MSMRRLLHRAFIVVAATLAAAAVCSCGGGSSSDSDRPDAAQVRQAVARLDTLVPQWMARTGVPGVAVAAVGEPATVLVTSGFVGVGKNFCATKFQPSRMAADSKIAVIQLRLSSTLFGLSSSQNIGMGRAQGTGS